MGYNSACLGGSEVCNEFMSCEGSPRHGHGSSHVQHGKLRLWQPNPKPSVTGIQVQPGDTTAYSSQTPPKNQAAFTANVAYNDGSLTPITSGVQWTYDFASWVSLAGNTATCTQPAPTVIGIPMTSQITATATVSGTQYTASALLTCL